MTAWWGQIRRWLNDAGVFDPPLVDQQREQTLRLFATLAIFAEASGPLAQLVGYFFGHFPEPVSRTSFVNLLLAALFVFTLISSRIMSLNSRVRLVAYGSFLIGFAALHNFMGGASSPAILFCAAPSIVAAFFLSVGESALVLLLTLIAWTVVFQYEQANPAPAAPFGVAWLHSTYAYAGLIALWGMQIYFFGAHRRSESLRRQQARQLEKAVAARDVFLATVSHELRTPLTAIVGLGDVFARNPQQVSIEKIKDLQRASVHLLEIVNNLLDLSATRSGATAVQLQATDVNQLLRDIAAMFRGLAPQGVVVDCAAEPLLPPLLVDREKLRRMLTNLVSNALKATSAGRIELCARLTPDQSPRLALSVSDTGAGFDPSAHLKPPSTALDWQLSDSARLEGMGLGLQIVQGLTAQLGGDLQIQSQPGRGCVATLSLPVEVCEPTSTAAASVVGNESADQATVVIVDDQEDIRNLFVLYCETLGYAARAFAAPEQAVEFVQSGAAVALVFMDISMPGTDGIAGRSLVLAALAERRAPVVALTAHAAERTHTDLRQHGFDAVLSKPLGLEQFAAAIRQVGAKT